MKGSTKLHYCRLFNGHFTGFQSKSQLEIRIGVCLDSGDGDEAPHSLQHLDVSEPGPLVLLRPQSLRVETLEERYFVLQHINDVKYCKREGDGSSDNLGHGDHGQVAPPAGHLGDDGVGGLDLLLLRLLL